MKAKEAADMYFEAVKAGKLPPTFGSDSRKYGEFGAEILDGKLHITSFDAYVRGGRLPEFHEWNFTRDELERRLAQWPYLPGIREVVGRSPGYFEVDVEDLAEEVAKAAQALDLSGPANLFVHQNLFIDIDTGPAREPGYPRYYRFYLLAVPAEVLTDAESLARLLAHAPGREYQWTH